MADEGYEAGDAAGIAPLSREQVALGPAFDDEISRFVAERLVVWRSVR